MSVKELGERIESCRLALKIGRPAELSAAIVSVELAAKTTELSLQKPSWMARVFGFDPATILLIIQLAQLLMEMLKMLKELRERNQS